MDTMDSCLNCCYQFKKGTLKQISFSTAADELIPVLKAMGDIFGISVQDLTTYLGTEPINENFSKEDVGFCVKCLPSLQKLYEAFKNLQLLSHNESILWGVNKWRRDKSSVDKELLELETDTEDIDNALANVKAEISTSSSSSESDATNEEDEENELTHNDSKEDKQMPHKDRDNPQKGESTFISPSSRSTKSSKIVRTAVPETSTSIQENIESHKSNAPLPPSPHKCILCSKFFETEEQLVQHGPFHPECPYCSKALLGTKELRFHVLIHKWEKPGPCRRCDAQFNDIDDVLKHFCRRNLSSIPKPIITTSTTHSITGIPMALTCTVCSNSFETKEALSEHHTSHPSLYFCGICGKNFPNIHSLITHEKIHKSYPFMCTQCLKRFTKPERLAEHMLTHSTEERPYMCSTCGKSFVTRATLSAHEKTHTEWKSHQCTICGTQVSTVRTLKEHMETHSEERKRPFLCDECGSAFLEKKALIKHRRIHTGEKPFACKFCDKRFSSSSSLAVHERIHTGEKPYECSICQKAFRNRDEYKMHLRSHTGEPPPYACKFCDKRFNSSSYTKSHERTHTGERPYKCTLCKKSFTKCSDLTTHKKTKCIKNSPKERQLNESV